MPRPRRRPSDSGCPLSAFRFYRVGRGIPHPSKVAVQVQRRGGFKGSNWSRCSVGPGVSEGIETAAPPAGVWRQTIRPGWTAPSFLSMTACQVGPPSAGACPTRRQPRDSGVFAITYDVAIIGAGHNGLVCSAYLAMAGLKVVV